MMKVYVVMRNSMDVETGCDVVGIFKSEQMAEQAARLYRNEWEEAGAMHNRYGPFEYHVEGWSVT